jgi:4-hydroxy-tetrahydrodipicolinate synthase
MKQSQAGALLGVVPVIPTPFTESEEIDVPALELLIKYACESGVETACLPAYGSEFYKLSRQEKYNLVGSAVKFSDGRIRIMAQSNHGSAKHAAEIARANEALGADLISVALPRQFPYGEEALLRYAVTVCEAVSVPVLIQDFNPGGSSVGAPFARKLKELAPNFQYLKLEEPGMGPKICAIREATGDAVGVLEGWGGMYLPDLFPAGLAGVMPGLPLCGLFVRLWNLLLAGDQVAALDLHTQMLPQILLSLQNMELFHHVEKQLLQALGVMKNAVVRAPAVVLDELTAQQIERVNRLAVRQVMRYAPT